jgi:hypothetical protein
LAVLAKKANGGLKFYCKILLSNPNGSILKNGKLFNKAVKTKETFLIQNNNRSPNILALHLEAFINGKRKLKH